jgi:hypothetical protein
LDLFKRSSREEQPFATLTIHKDSKDHPPLAKEQTRVGTRTSYSNTTLATGKTTGVGTRTHDDPAGYPALATVSTGIVGTNTTISESNVEKQQRSGSYFSLRQHN